MEYAEKLDAVCRQCEALYSCCVFRSIVKGTCLGEVYVLLRYFGLFIVIEMLSNPPCKMGLMEYIAIVNR